MLMDLLPRKTSSRARVRVKRNPRVARAQQNLLESDLKPLIEDAEAKRMNIFLPCQGKVFTPIEFVAQLNQGRYVWGRRWFRLVGRAVVQ